MARDRTNDEILDQAVYAVACVAHHYGPGFSAEGLADVRRLLTELGPWGCDSSWRVDIPEGEGEPNPDFCPKHLPKEFGWIEFDDITRASRTGLEEGMIVGAPHNDRKCYTCGKEIGKQTYYQCHCGREFCCMTTCPICTSRTGDTSE